MFKANHYKPACVLLSFRINNPVLFKLALTNDWETGGINVYRSYGSITITNNIISGCVGSEGGGVYAESDGGSVIITNNIITKNKAEWGGGIEGNFFHLRTISRH